MSGENEEVKITGEEPASDLTIRQKAQLDFMVALSVLPRKKPREVAQEAENLVEAYIAICNNEDWNPRENSE